MTQIQNNLKITDLAAAVVAEDDDLRNDLKALVQDMIGVMRITMRHGTAAEKLALSKSIVPQLLTAIAKVDQGERDSEQRAAYERMMAELRGEA